MRVRAIPVEINGQGLTDARDASGGFPGCMATLQNLIPAPGDAKLLVPRPAALSILPGSPDWGGIDTPKTVTVLFALGNTLFGMINCTHGTYNGLDQPFSFNVLTKSFNTISIPGGAASCPTSQSASGDWTPPRMAAWPGRVMVTHPGFDGIMRFVGWIDFSEFSDNTVTGSTHSSTTIDTLSTNVLLSGWQVGYTITGAGIPANTTIVSIASDGLSLVLSNAATATAAGVALTVAGGSVAAPLWGSGNVNGYGFAKIPTDVFNFNGRAYYAVPNGGAAYSDVASPTQRTNASQALKPNNGLDITCFGGLPYWQSAGGILQALIAFQGDAGIQQITGDAALNNLVLNQMAQGVGCLAPNTLAITPLGLMFLATDGLRYIDFYGSMQEPIGAYGKGVNNPIINAISPSRAVAAYNEDVYRFSLQNGGVIGQPYEDYWFHVSKKVFTGPHTFPADHIVPYQAPTGTDTGQGFLMSAQGVDAGLWSSSALYNLNSTFVENGTALQFVWRTNLTADNNVMTENSIVESTLMFRPSVGSNIQLNVYNELGTQLDTLTLIGPGMQPVWGTAVWGQDIWGGASNEIWQYDLPWHLPIVFKQGFFEILGYCASQLAIGSLRYNNQILGYRLETNVVGGFV